MQIHNRGFAKQVFIALLAGASTLVILNTVSIFFKQESFLCDYRSVPDKIVRVRNRLSNTLNDARKEIGKMECQMAKENRSTSKHGGWCKHISKENAGEHLTDTKIIPHLSFFLKGKTVGSFGEGPGSYKREIMKLHQVQLYDAYDGAPYSEENSNGSVKFLDLTIPQFGIPLYDWIISLEVAEHIPKEFELVYLDNIFRHAKEGIILSWAVPGQGGLQHINNKPLEYVIHVMEENGFYRDEHSSKKFQDSANLWWIRTNINVYRRKNYSTFESERRLVQWFI